MYNIIKLCPIEQFKKLSFFITQHFYENILSPKSIEDECLILITKMLMDNIDELQTYNSKCNCLLGSLYRNKDIKDYFNIVLAEIIEKIENEKDFLMTFNLMNIQKEIEEYKLLNPQKFQFSTRLLVLEQENYSSTNEKDYKGSIQFKDNSLFYTKYLSECLVDDFLILKSELKENNLIEYYDKIYNETRKKNPENNYVISHYTFLNLISNMSESSNILATYQRNFFSVKQIILDIVNNLNQNVHFIPYFIKFICRIIFIILTKNKSMNKIDALKYIAKFFFSQLLSPIILSPDYECLIGSFIISQQTLDNLLEINKIILKILDFSFFDEEKENNYTPFNWFILDVIPKIFELLNNMMNTKLPSYIIDLFENKEYFYYDYFKENPSQLFHYFSICFNIEELLILFNIIKNNIDKLSSSYTEKDKIIRNEFFENVNSLLNVDLINILTGISNKENIKKNFFLISGREDKKDFSKLMQLKQDVYKSYSRAKTNNDIENLIIDFEKNLCCLLYNYEKMDINKFQNCKNLSDIIEKITYLLKNIPNLTKDLSPCENYGKKILELLDQIPNEYKENQFSKLFNIIKNNLRESLKNLNLEPLAIFEEQLKYAEQINKIFSFYLETLEMSQPNKLIREFVQTPDPELKVTISNNYECIIEKAKTPSNPKTIECDTILQFIRKFPKLTLIQGLKGIEVLEYEEQINLNEKLKFYFSIIEKVIDNREEEFNIGKGKNTIYRKIIDYIFSKIYDKMFPPESSMDDLLIYQNCIRYSWITLDLLIDKDYVLDNLIPSTNKFFKMLEHEKSPEKKTNIFRKIDQIIKNTSEFNRESAGQDELNPFYLYIILQAQLQKLSSNLKYIQYYIPNDEFETPMFATIRTVIDELSNFSINSLPYAKNFELNDNIFEKYCNYAANGKPVILKKRQEKITKLY